MNPQREIGEMIVSTWLDPAALDYRPRIHIDRADPVIWIHDEMLREFKAADDERVSFADDVLTLRAENRTVVYRLVPDGYDWQKNAHLAEWPD